MLEGGYDWSLVSCLQTLLHCRRGCCRFCSFSFSFLCCFAPYLYCRNPVILMQQVKWGLQVSLSSESCSKPFPRSEFSLKHLPLWLPLPPSGFCRLVQDRCFFPADLFQVVDFTAQSRPFFRTISKSSSEYDDFSFLRYQVSCVI